MVEPISLNRVRKAKRKDDDRTKAAANRLKFGRTAAEKATDRALEEKAASHVEGHRRED